MATNDNFKLDKDNVSKNFYIITFITIYKVFLLACLLAFGVFSLKMFTYVNYLLTTLSFLFLSLILTKAKIKKHITKTYVLYSLFIFPITWGLTIFVAIAINIIIYLNSDMIMKTSEYNHGPNQFSQIYIVDKLIHTLPAFEILIIMILNLKNFRIITSEIITFNDYYNKFIKAVYIIYFFTFQLLFLFLYMIYNDFNKNYPTGLSIFITIPLVIICSLIIQFIYFILVWSFKKNNSSKIVKKIV